MSAIHKITIYRADQSMCIVHTTCGWRGLQNTCVTQCLTPLFVEWGPVYIVEWGPVYIVEWGPVYIVEWGPVYIVEWGPVYIVEWGPVYIVEWGPVYIVEWGPVYIARLIRFKTHKHTTMAMWPSIPSTPGTCINPIHNVPLYTEVRRIRCTSSPLLSWSDLSCSPHKCVLVISLVNKATENPRLFAREADIFRSPRRRGRISVELVRSDRHGCMEAQDEQRLWLLTACGIKGAT